jgi:hypothetical protein
MKKVRMVLSWWIPIVLISVALMTPAVTQAKSIKIWPDQLIPQEPNTDEYFQNVSYVSNGHFYAPFALPKGARITNITYYHYGTGSPFTSLIIWRGKMGNLSEAIGSAYNSDASGVVVPVEVTLSGDPIIRAGYRYSITVQANTSTSYLWGVKITYKE